MQYTKHHLAWFRTGSMIPKLAYVNMLSILKQTNSIENASKVKLGLYDGKWYTKYNGTTFVTIFQMMTEFSYYADLPTFRNCIQ